MKNDFTELIGRVAELQGRSMELSARIREDSRSLSELQHDLSAALRELWPLVHPRESAPAPTSSAPHMLRVAEVAKRVGLARSSVWRMVKDGLFPPPRRLSERAVGWPSGEVESWLSSRETFKSQEAPG